MGKILMTICSPLAVASTIAELVIALNKTVNTLHKIYSKKKSCPEK